MNRAALEWYELLARSLVWIAGIVLLLSAVAAIVIAGSENSAPLLEDLEKQGRGIAAIAALGGGLTSAGLLAALGAILRMLVTERLEALGPAPERGRDTQTQLPFDDEAATSPASPPASTPRRRERR